jgi:hypothetical protein
MQIELKQKKYKLLQQKYMYLRRGYWKESLQIHLQKILTISTKITNDHNKKDMCVWHFKIT